MSRPSAQADSLPPSARAIALLVASTPGVHDAQPGVLHQLLEFSHRYAAQALSDAQVYSEHAGRNGRIEMADVTLAVQARVGWEFGGRVPKDYLLSLATQTNSVPLPAVPEVFGVRLPPPFECLTAVDFDLVPNRPPPDVKIFDEEIEEIEEDDDEDDVEDDDDDDADMEPAAIPRTERASTSQSEDAYMHDASSVPPQPPLSTAQSPSDVEMRGTPAPTVAKEEEEEEEDDDGLFGGGEDDEGSGDDAAGAPAAEGGAKRRLEEEDDYD